MWRIVQIVIALLVLFVSKIVLQILLNLHMLCSYVQQVHPTQ